MDWRMEKPGLDPETLREFVKQYGKDAEPSPHQEPVGSGGGDSNSPPGEKLNFSLKPEELIAYLDGFVVRQEEAKAILATKICTHFNRLNLPGDDEEMFVGSIKNNVLMIGPTGVGKTFLIKLIAHRLGVPFVKADATKFSETGYVGGDVEDLIRELVSEADGDIELAEHGIIYIDEIDKIASTRTTTGPDVSGSGVQRNLLKLMEETEVDLKAPHDISSQMESVIQIQRTGKAERKKINTRNILFVVSGAFGELQDIIARRLNRGAMGFRLRDARAPAENTVADGELLKEVRAEDLVDFGFESEFIGRLPVIAVLHNLDREDLLQILRGENSSVVLSKKRDFKAYGIDLEFTDGALQKLSEMAFEEQIGARGLVSVVEKVLLRFETRLPSTDIGSFTVTERTVLDPAGELKSMLVDTSLQSFSANFSRDHGIHLSFSCQAVETVKGMARAQGRLPGEVCEEILSDYGHGLKLLELEQFEVTPEVLSRPQEVLNQLIKDLYSPGATGDH